LERDHVQYEHQNEDITKWIKSKHIRKFFLPWRVYRNPSPTCARGIIFDPRGKILLKYGWHLGKTTTK